MKSWLIDQFKAARQEVQSWSPGKQAMMKNAIRKEPDEKKCTICTKYDFIVIGSMQKKCWIGKQWPRIGICRYRTVKESNVPIKYEFNNEL